MKKLLIYILAFIATSCAGSCGTPTKTNRNTYIIVPPNTVAIIIPKEELTGTPRETGLNAEEFRLHLEEQYPAKRF